jgi:triacylglycerol esterase/lipase EstA (alpha/beta hydrolase family)
LPNISDFINYTYSWPKDWLGFDLNRKCNIYGVNYNSILTYWDNVGDKNGNNNTIKMRSSDLKKQLEMANIGKKPVIWVCHSMGGLILKQLLLNLSKTAEGSSILDKTRGIIFYSTPHLGSKFIK